MPGSPFLDHHYHQIYQGHCLFLLKGVQPALHEGSEFADGEGGGGGTMDSTSANRLVGIDLGTNYLDS